jgi:pimeloyl-ACP methyl ester carboxylesterase
VHCAHQGKGEAILFIHGMPTNRMLWNGVIQRLSSHYKCFAVDLPGMGETPFTPYSRDYLVYLAEQIELLRLEHRVKKWHIVGHDAGSAIAVQYAAHFSSRVTCLALLSPAIFPDLKPFFLLNALRQPLVGEVLAPLVHFAFWQIAMRRAIAGAANSSLLRAFHEPFSGPAGAWKLMRLVRWGKPADMLGEIPARLSALPMPTLLVHGMRDVLPEAFAQRAASLIPKSRLVTLDTGHFIPLDKPEEVATGLHAFFRDNGASMNTSRNARRPQRGSSHARPVVTESLTLESPQSIAHVS